MTNAVNMTTGESHTGWPDCGRPIELRPTFSSCVSDAWGRSSDVRVCDANDYVFVADGVDDVPGGSENVIVARLLPTARVWQCTMHGCRMTFAELSALQTHACTHTRSGAQKQRSFASPPTTNWGSDVPTPKRNGSASLRHIEAASGVHTEAEQHFTEHFKHFKQEAVGAAREAGCRQDQPQGLERGVRTSLLHKGSPPMVCAQPGCLFRASTAWGLAEHARNKHTIRSSRAGGDAEDTAQVQVQVRHPPCPRVWLANTPLCNTFVPEKKVGRQAAACRCTRTGCDFSTSFKRTLKAHTRTHTGEKPHRCGWRKCSFTSVRAGDIVEHTRTHTGKRPFVCKWAGCHYASAQASNLKRHGLVHTGEKPFPCTWDGCTHRSTTASNLKQHVQTHTREKPFVCSWDGCEHRAARANDLRRHAARVHGYGRTPAQLPLNQVLNQV
jgi:hypothetical protein